MGTIDFIGFIGVFLILIAYFLNLNNKLQSNDLKYLVMNFTGASLACFASVLLEYIPFVVLEGTWAVVSLFALIKYFRDGKI